MSKQKYFSEEEKKQVNKIWQERYRRKKGIPQKRKYFTKEQKQEANKKNNERYRRKKGCKIRIYRTKEETRLLKNERAKNYYKQNKKEINYRIKNKLNQNINFKLAHHLRSRLCRAIHNNQKSGSAVKDLGCSIPELKTYLESRFQNGMNWKNYGFYGWHIDHVIPLDSFDLTNREEFLRACHYTNLQPMWAKENIRKNNKV